MRLKELPHTDQEVAYPIIEKIHSYHGSYDLLNFAKMDDKQTDNYIEVWFANMPAHLLEDVYHNAMLDNTMAKDTIMQLYTSPKDKAETEKELLRNAFRRPHNNPQDQQSWAQRIEECVNHLLADTWSDVG